MKMKIAALLAGLLLSGLAEAKVVRATELTSPLWAKLNAGAADDLVVEFRQGDELPVSLTAEGDLLETNHVGTSYVAVKRSFWLRMRGKTVEMSLDGTAFKPIQDVVTGTLTAGAGSEQNGGVADAINVGLKATLK